MIVELGGSPAAIATLRALISWGLLALVPALALATASGRRLARGRHDELLAAKAGAREFDAAFDAVQAVELAAGAVNATLLGRNMRDGIRVTGRLRNRRATP